METIEYFDFSCPAHDQLLFRGKTVACRNAKGWFMPAYLGGNIEVGKAVNQAISGSPNNCSATDLRGAVCRLLGLE